MHLAFALADFNAGVFQEDLQFSVLDTVFDGSHIAVFQDGNIPVFQALRIFGLDHISVAVCHCAAEDGKILALALEGEDRNGTDERDIQFAGDQAGGQFGRTGELRQGNVQAFFLKVALLFGDEAEQVSGGVQVAQAEISLFNSGVFRTGRNGQRKHQRQKRGNCNNLFHGKSSFQSFSVCL